MTHFKNSISAKALTFKYPNGSAILKKLDIEIKTGEILCILGPNGVGKTTLLNCLAGLYQPQSGDISINGQNLFKIPQRQIAKRIGYVPQNISATFDYEVLDFVVTGCAHDLSIFERPRNEHYQRAMDALSQMGIAHLKGKSFMRISGGERQQVMIARTIAQRPSFIFLDEPTAHLDFGNQIKMLKTIRNMAKEGYGMVLTTHNPDHVFMLESKVAVLGRENSFQFGFCNDLLDEEFLTKLYGENLKVGYMDELERIACLAVKL